MRFPFRGIISWRGQNHFPHFLGQFSLPLRAVHNLAVKEALWKNQKQSTPVQQQTNSKEAGKTILYFAEGERYEVPPGLQKSAGAIKIIIELQPHCVGRKVIAHWLWSIGPTRWARGAIWAKRNERKQKLPLVSDGNLIIGKAVCSRVA